MPDMEKITDEALCEIAEMKGGISERRYYEGIRDGKTKARKEIVILSFITAVIYILTSLYLN